MAFSLDTITAKASGIFGGVGDSLIYLVPVLLILAVIALFFYKNLFYRYNVEIIRLRANGGYKTFMTRGGFITRKSSPPSFKIVLDRFGFKTKEIFKAPEMESIGMNEKIIFIQTDVDTFVQARETLDISERLIKFSPVETDVKYGAVLDIHRMKNALETESTWKQIVPYISLAVIFTACIVGWYMLMKAKCPV